MTLSAISLGGLSPWLAGMMIIGLIAIGLVKAFAAHKQVEDSFRRGLDTATGAFIDDLVARVAKLETDLTRMTERMSEQAIAHERTLNEMRRAHDTEMKIMRHRLNNERMSFDMVLNMAEVSPEKLPAIMLLVKEDRSRRDAMINAELMGKKS